MPPPGWASRNGLSLGQALQVAMNHSHPRLLYALIGQQRPYWASPTPFTSPYASRNYVKENEITQQGCRCQEGQFSCSPASPPFCGNKAILTI